MPLHHLEASSRVPLSGSGWEGGPAARTPGSLLLGATGGAARTAIGGDCPHQRDCLRPNSESAITRLWLFVLGSQRPLRVKVRCLGSGVPSEARSVSRSHLLPGPAAGHAGAPADPVTADCPSAGQHGGAAWGRPERWWVLLASLFTKTLSTLTLAPGRSQKVANDRGGKEAECSLRAAPSGGRAVCPAPGRTHHSAATTTASKPQKRGRLEDPHPWGVGGPRPGSQSCSRALLMA